MTIKLLSTATLITITLTACGKISIEEQMKDCRSVAPQHIENILTGMENTVDIGKFKLSHVYAVRSNDRKKIYFVSGELIYIPTSTFHGTGTWVLNNIDSQGSFYWAMPGPAVDLTIYPDATQNKAKISIWDHGYTQSRDCTRLGAEN